MKEDIFLEFLYNLINTNQLLEQTQIVKYYKNFPILEKDVEKRETLVNFAIVRVKLENGDFLLVEDIPINFLLSHTILVGRDVELIRFKLKNEDMVFYISTKDICKRLDNVIEESIESFDAKKLFKKKYEFEFELPKIIIELKKYLSEKKKLDFNRIHISDFEKIENFVPSVKQNHFRLAEEMKLPLISLIEENYIRESAINISDSIGQVKIMKPILTRQEKILWDYQKKTTNKLYKDISTQLFMKVDFDLLDEKLDKVKTNIDKKIILRELIKVEWIKLSSKKKGLLIPVWKSLKYQDYLKIKNKEEFEELSGRKFKFEEEFLKNIYMQSSDGDKAIFKSYYLKKDLEEMIDNLKDEKRIVFRDFRELILKLNFAKNVEEIDYFEDLHPAHIRELKKLIKKLIKITTLKSVEFNKIPEQIRALNVLQEYYLSVANSIYIDYEEFLKVPLKKELLKKTITKTSKLLEVVRFSEIEFEDLYFFVQNILILIKVLRVYDEETANEFEELFYSYYKNKKFSIFKSKNKPDLEVIVNDSMLANKLSRKYKVTIVRKKEFDANLLDEDISVISENLVSKRIVKPNILTLKKLFKNLYNEVYDEIRNLNGKYINETKEIVVKGRKIPLNKEMFEVYKKYPGMKRVENNKFFGVFIEK